MNRAARLQRLEEILLSAPDGYEAQELADRLNIHVSTAYRDLDELSLHTPMQKEGTRYFIDRMDYLSNVKLSGSESLMLYLAMRRMIRRTSHSPDMMVSAMEKLTLALRHPSAQQLAKSVRVMQGQQSADPDRAQVWEVLIRGWLDQITVRIRHQKFDSATPNEYEFQPYLFEPAILSEGVYVIGHSLSHGSLRTFKVERILQVSLMTDTFTRPDNISIDDLLRHAWGIWYGEDLFTVRLRFRDQAVARRVKETIWHPSQVIDDLPNGGVDWSVQVAGMIELVPWIRGWGPDCEVLEPPELREMIAEGMRRGTALYRASE